MSDADVGDWLLLQDVALNMFSQCHYLCICYHL